jgi:hypothetical protein
MSASIDLVSYTRVLCCVNHVYSKTTLFLIL